MGVPKEVLMTAGCSPSTLPGVLEELARLIAVLPFRPFSHTLRPPSAFDGSSLHQVTVRHMIYHIGPMLGEACRWEVRAPADHLRPPVTSPSPSILLALIWHTTPGLRRENYLPVRSLTHNDVLLEVSTTAARIFRSEGDDHIWLARS